MKITFSVLFLLVVVAFAGLTANAQKTRCRVADPTGTRLNVRATGASNGRIVAKLSNDTLVRVEYWTKDPVTAEPWAKISVFRVRKWVPIGFVFGEYLDCAY